MLMAEKRTKKRLNGNKKKSDRGASLKTKL